MKITFATLLLTLAFLGPAQAASDHDYLCAPANNNPGYCNQLSYCYYQPGSCVSRNGQQDYLCQIASNDPGYCNQLSYCQFSPGSCLGR